MIGFAGFQLADLDRWVFETPEAFWLLGLVPVLVWFAFWRTMRSPLGFSSASRLASAPTTWRVKLRHVPLILRTAALVLLVVAVARPREGQDRTRTVTNGVAIMAVIDRSLSMTERLRYGDERPTRFGVVKRVLRDFIAGDGEELAGREGDLVGIVQFARLADTQAPPVQDHDTVLSILDSLELAPRTQLEAGTSIGEALALAAARLESLTDQLQTAEQRMAADDGFVDPEIDEKGDPDFVINSRVVILLTDGDEKTGDIPALEAAKLCAEWDITVYTIGIGNEFGRFGFDESTLRRIADMTGGLYRRATDGDSLRAVYQEIDSLEKTEVRSLSFTTYREWYHVPLALALALLAFEAAVSALVLRRTG